MRARSETRRDCRTSLVEVSHKCLLHSIDVQGLRCGATLASQVLHWWCRPERVVQSWFGRYSLLARHASSSLVMRLPRKQAHMIMHMLLDNPSCPLVRGRADKV